MDGLDEPAVPFDSDSSFDWDPPFDSEVDVDSERGELVPGRGEDGEPLPPGMAEGGEALGIELGLELLLSVLQPENARATLAIRANRSSGCTVFMAYRDACK